MSNKQWEKKMNEQHDAHLLMTEFVKREAEDIARALECFATVRDELTYESLQQNMGVVSQTFAGLALQLIQHNSSLEPSDMGNIILPVGAKAMNDTMDDLSKLIISLREMFRIVFDLHGDEPAIMMANKAFWDCDTKM